MCSDSQEKTPWRAIGRKRRQQVSRPSAADWRKSGSAMPRGRDARTGNHTFTVQKPFCCPIEPILRKALETYGVPVIAYDEYVSKVSLAEYLAILRIELKHWDNLRYGPMAGLFLPLAMEAKVTVPIKQAKFAEYLIERTGRIAVVGNRIDRKNREWAHQHGGTMPTPWGAVEARKSARGRAAATPEAQVEAGCKKGHDIWKTVLGAIEVEQKKGARK